MNKKNLIRRIFLLIFGSFLVICFTISTLFFLVEVFRDDQTNIETQRDDQINIEKKSDYILHVNADGNNIWQKVGA